MAVFERNRNRVNIGEKCRYYTNCEGVCNNYKRYRIKLNEKEGYYWDISMNEFLYHIEIDEERGGFIQIEPFYGKTLFLDDQGYCKKTAPLPFLERLPNSKFKLKKGELIDFFRKEWHYEIEYCPNIKVDKTIEIIRNLPDIIEIRDRAFKEIENNLKKEISKKIAKIREFLLEDRLYNIKKGKKLERITIKIVSNRHSIHNIKIFADNGIKLSNKKSEKINNLETVLKEIEGFPTQDEYDEGFIGLINNKEEAIQFTREEKEKWLIDVARKKNIHANKKYFTTEEIKEIVIKFCKDENWSELCKYDFLEDIRF